MKKNIKHHGEAKIYSSGGDSDANEKVLVIPGFGETISHNKELVDALSSKRVPCVYF